MISLPTPIASPTSPSLTNEQRESLAESIALRYLDSMNGRDLEQFFIEVQLEHIREYTDTELIGELEDLMDAEEFNEMIGDLK
jgi:hypothetical protein